LTIVLVLNLVAVGVIAFKLLPRNQLPQIISVVVLAALGLSLGISAAHNRHWFVRAVIVLLGLGGAAAAWWFVPTTGGVSLYTAQRDAARLCAELEDLPAGDSARFLEIDNEFYPVLREFPEYRPRFEQLRGRWQTQSESKWEAELSQLGLRDLASLADLRRAYQPFMNGRLDAAELAWFTKCYRALVPGDFGNAVKLRALARSDDNWKRKLRAWETDWANRTVDDVVNQVSPVMARDPRKASERLRETARRLSVLDQFDDAQTQLLAARMQAFRAALQTAKQEAFAAVLKEKYQEADSTSRAVRAWWEDEARAVGAHHELAQFCDGYEFLALMAQLAKKKDPM
jgi:hypothetical protein